MGLNLRLSPTLSRYLGRHFLISLGFVFLVAVLLVFLADLIETLRRSSGRDAATLGVVLQLTLLRRRSGPDVALENNLGRIHENLQRMSEVIGSLKQLRRVVLTDYVDGVKMLDLRESIREDESRSAAGQ